MGGGTLVTRLHPNCGLEYRPRPALFRDSRFPASCRGRLDLPAGSGSERAAYPTPGRSLRTRPVTSTQLCVWEGIPGTERRFRVIARAPRTSNAFPMAALECTDYSFPVP